MICASDSLGMDGNCVSFVAVADRLGALYRAELQKLGADSKDSLLSTSWWGCGPPSLFDVKRLLMPLGSEPAWVVLTTEPYRSLPAVPAPPTPPPATEPLGCVDLSNPVERNLCVGAKLQSVRAYHDAAYANCKSVVTPGPLLEQLTAAESTFKAELGPLCDADIAEAGENAKVRPFDRSSCMVTA